MHSVIDMWISHGYIRKNGSSSKTSKDIGEGYFQELVAMCFFERCSKSFKMHDLMHDLAKSISHGEICILKLEQVKQSQKMSTIYMLII